MFDAQDYKHPQLVAIVLNWSLIILITCISWHMQEEFLAWDPLDETSYIIERECDQRVSFFELLVHTILAGGTSLLSLDDIQTITVLKQKGIKDDNVMS